MNSKSLKMTLAFALALALGSVNVSNATTVEPLYYFAALDNWGSNPLGVTPGLYGNIGGGFSPASGTQVTAEQMNPEGVTISGPLFYRVSPGLPYEFGRLLPWDQLSAQGLTGAWTLTASNGSDSVKISTLAPATVSPPSITNVQTNGLSTTPTLSWTRPAFVVPAGYSEGTAITVWDLNLPSGQQVVLRERLDPATTSYTMPAGVLDVGHNYAISVESTLRNQADVGVVTMTLGSLAAATRDFFNFSPSADPVQFDAPVNLPVQTHPGEFTFNMDIENGVPYLIDPTIAIGYDFAIGEGNPLFASVLFPDLGNFLYQIYVWDGFHWILDDSVAALTTFQFDGLGVDRFRVLGIDPSIALDPNSPTAFVTEVTFAGNGRFTGTMTAITAQVPEPSTLLLFGLGLFGLLIKRTTRQPA